MRAERGLALIQEAKTDGRSGAAKIILKGKFQAEFSSLEIIQINEGLGVSLPFQFWFQISRIQLSSLKISLALSYFSLLAQIPLK